MTSLELQLSELRGRLQKEIERGRVELTIGAGGLTVLGNKLEAFARTAANLCLQMKGQDMRSALRQRKVVAGAGTYLRILAEMDTKSVSDPLLAATIRDARSGPQSVLGRLAQIRNANNHDGGSLELIVENERYSPQVMRAMESAALWIDRLRRDT